MRTGLTLMERRRTTFGAVFVAACRALLYGADVGIGLLAFRWRRR